MSYKPNETTLIAYLYDELDNEEKRNVEVYLSEHPEAASEVRRMRETLQIMTKLGDKEVIAPPLMMEHDRVVPIWRTRYFRAIASVAASIILILVVGRLSGINITYADAELRISFGKPIEQKTEEPVPQLTEAEVNSMITTALTRNNEQLTEAWTQNDAKLKQSIQNVMKTSSKQINEMVTQASGSSQEQIRSYVASLQSQNLQLMRDYMQLTTTEQKQYVENLLVDFSKYLQEQRTQDLMFFQARMTNMEKNTDEFKQATEQILGTILASGSTKDNRNNY